LHGERPIVLGDGQQTREFSYVTDIAEGIIALWECPKSRGHIINLSSGHETTINEIVQMITKLMDYKGEIEYMPPRPGDVRRHHADISRARQLIKYQPRVDLQTGLKLTIEWYRQRENLL